MLNSVTLLNFSFPEFLIRIGILEKFVYIHWNVEALTVLPLRLLPFVVAPSPGLPRGDRFIWQKRGETPFEGVRIPTDRVSRVTVITALPMEADITGGTDEERLQQLPVGDLINLRGQVQRSARYWHRPSESQ